MKLFNSLLLASAMTATFAMAQDDSVLKPAVDEAAKINESAAKSQDKINNIADQIDSKLQAFKTLNKEIEDQKYTILMAQKSGDKERAKWELTKLLRLVPDKNHPVHIKAKSDLKWYP